MDAATIWRQFFATWPDGVPQKGVAVTTFGEQIMFVKYLMSEQVLMLERLAPDSVGGRRVIIPYDQIQSVKITDPVNDDVFLKAGYLPGGKRTAATGKTT
jgi:hypothetical protein